MQKEIYLYSQESSKNPTYFAVQGDTGRNLTCHIVDVDVVNEVTSATIWVEKPDGTHVYNDGVINDDGTVTVPITSQTLAAIGKAKAMVQLIGPNGYISTYEFIIKVLATIIDEEAVESSNEWGVLQELLKKANAVIVSTKAEMTDHSKIYFLSTDGHFYYWSQVDNDFVKTELSHADIVDALTSTDATKVLSAKQGKILNDEVVSIESKIPAQATSSNKLADKEFVNSSIATETSHYISNNGQPFTSVAQLEAYSGTVTNNDYAFVTGTDSEGNVFYDRYKATASGSTVTWAKEYRLNNSSFTAEQWASINSGITQSGVTQIGANTTHIGNLAQLQTISKDNLVNAINEAAENGGVAVQPTEPTNTVLAWVDTDEEGADFCYVGDEEPPNDGSVAVWIDTSEEGFVNTETAEGISYDNSVSGIEADNVQEAIDVGFTGVESKTLLWTNASPSSNFNEQTISIDFSEYDDIEVLSIMHKTQTTMYVPPVRTTVGGKGCTGCPSGTSGATQGSLYLFGRVFETSQNSITFKYNYAFRSDQSASGWQPNNDGLIPVKIFGIKKVVA